MSFQIGLSGLSAASRSLDAIGNNIANANTVGAKVARVEFSEIVAAANGQTEGVGVEVAAVSQRFTQGSMSQSGRPLDIAIDGTGFFSLALPDGTSAYTRAGQFQLNTQGNVVNNSGAKLMGYPTSVNGVATSSTLQPMQLPTSSPIPARATTSITAEFNLNASAQVWNDPLLVPSVPLTTYGTSLNTYDSQGSVIPASVYMRKTANDAWEVYTDPTSDATATSSQIATLAFGTNGQLLSSVPANPTINVTSPNPAIGTFNPTLDLTGATQFATAFSVTDLLQDGYAPGDFVTMSIEKNGVVLGRYSNGQTLAAGQIALADFRNVQGLRPISNGSWVQTIASGQPIVGEPAAGKFGSLRSGALEDSNIDLTAELVNMMTAQRTYQANAQTIKTQDQVLSTLTQLR